MKTLTNLFIRSLLLTVVTTAQWSSDPASPQLLGSGVQAQVKATSDGGVYVAWLTDMGGYHVYLQRFDATGVAQFDDGGMLVSDHNNESWIAVFHMNLAVDSDNNAIITVLDTRVGPWNVYAYKIAPDGSMLWGDDGVSVSNSNQTNYSPRLAVLPDNSVVVAWSPNSTTVEIQRISSDGGLMWGDGILIEDNIESLMSPQPIVNSNGDALVQWIGQSGPIWAADSKIYLQKYDLNGNAQWDNPAVAVGPVVFPMGNWSQQLVAEASGGSFLAWTQMSGNVQNAVAQLISVEGVPVWTGGVDLSTNSSNFRMSPMLSIAEETQELMAVWKESNGSQSQRGIFAQRLDSNGNQLWGSTGTTVVALNNSYDYLDLAVAGLGEEIISAYIQQSSNMSGDIYANRLDAEGNSVWTEETVTVTNSGMAKSDMVTGKGPNCLFITWSENGSVFAHCLLEDGTLVASAVTLLLVPELLQDNIRQFRYMALKTHDPQERYKKAVQLLSSTFYQNVESFGGLMTGLFSTNSKTVNRLLKNQRCVLEFDFQQQKFRVIAGIKVMLKKNLEYEFTYWHNYLFNPYLSPDVTVIGFEPVWSETIADPTL